MSFEARRESLVGFGQHALEGFKIGWFLKQRQPGHGAVEHVVHETTQTMDLSPCAKTEGWDKRRKAGDVEVARPRSWPLGRRSGRFPPLPYPPPRSSGF